MMISRSERFTLVCALSMPLLSCAPKEYTAFQPDRAKWLEADKDAAANAKEMKEPAILPKTYYAAGQLFEQQGQVQKAIFQYQRAIALQQDYVPAYNRIGVLLGKLGQHTEAEDALRKAVGMRPDWAYLRNNLGYEYMLQERWPDAEGELRTALRLKPDFARAHNNLGVVLAKLGRFDEALAEFKEAMPESDALYNLGMMFKNENRYPEAAGAFERAVGLAPRFDEARTQLAVVAPGSNREAPRQQPADAYAQPYTAVAARSIQPPIAIEPISSYPSPAPAPTIVAAAPVPMMAAQSPAVRKEFPTIAWQVPTDVVPSRPIPARHELAAAEVEGNATAPVFPSRAVPSPDAAEGRAAFTPAEAPIADAGLAAPIEFAAPSDPTVLLVEAVLVEALATDEMVGADPGGPLVEYAEIQSEVEPFHVQDAAADEPCIDDFAPLAGALAAANDFAVDFEDPCAEDITVEFEAEPIESFAELADEVRDPRPTAAPAWEGRFNLISWIWDAFIVSTAAETAAAESASIHPASEPFLFEVNEIEPVVASEEILAVLCDFSTDGVAHFEPAADWREHAEGFDASLAFLSLIRNDGVVEALQASTALSMVIGD